MGHSGEFMYCDIIIKFTVLSKFGSVLWRVVVGHKNSVDIIHSASVYGGTGI